jgi:CheY-like chemotaxis protein
LAQKPNEVLAMTGDKVLIIDDDQDVRQAMADLLKIEGFSAASAANGLEGLEKMRSEDHISMVLLDLWMPQMDGWEFLRQKGRDARIADVPVVVLSSIPPVSLDGAETILRKPVDTEPLLQILRRHCRGETTAQ